MPINQDCTKRKFIPKKIMDYTTLFLFLSSLCLCVAVLMRKWRRRLPPGPFPLPIVGNLFDLRSESHRSLTHLASIYGSLMSLKLGSVTTVVVSSPSMAKQILQTHDQDFASRTVPDSIHALNHHNQSIIWLPASTQWRKLRKICNTQLFTTQKLDSNQGLRIQKVKELLAYIEENCKDGSPVDIGQLVFSTFLNLLSNTAFSKDLTSLESGYGQEFKALVQRLSEESARPNLGDFFPILRSFDLQGVRHNVEVIFGKFHELFEGMIKERLVSREFCVSSRSTDFLDAILDYKDEDGAPLSNPEIKSLLTDLFVAGMDTNSNTLEWVMAELLHNPSKLAKVKLELNEKIGKDKPIDESSVEGLPYLQAVVKETFRLHPPAPFLVPHKAESDVEISGFIVPKNAQVLVNLWAIGKDANTWDDPNSFNPERFSHVNIDFRGRHFELIPFGAGRRMCPGFPLAYRMLHLMLASLLHAFDWKLEEGVKPEDMDMEESSGLTLQKAKVLMAIPYKT